jgi:hypothetical protein
VSWKRGRPSNRRYSDAFRDLVIGLVREHYVGFTPSLTREYLDERQGIRVASETLRQMIMAADLWQDREARRPRPYQPRVRKAAAVSWYRSMDRSTGGSKTAGRNAPFCSISTTRPANSCTWRWWRARVRSHTCERHGKLVALYSDKHRGHLSE